MGSRGLWVVNAREVCKLTKQKATVKTCVQPDASCCETEQNACPCWRGVCEYLGLGAHLGLELLLSVT